MLRSRQREATAKQDSGIGYWSALAIGIGGMVGGGIFAVLGLAVQLAGGGTPLAFLIAGGVALLTSYSYAKLSVAFPSQGGTVVFVDRAFGVDLFTGTLNNLLWLSYIVMLALYAFAFGSYGATFFPAAHQALARHVLISAGIVVPMLLNMLSAGLIGKAETYIVGIKVSILGFFVAVGLGGIDAQRLAPASWAPTAQLVAGGMIIFLAYEGFELIANAAQDVSDPKKVLPRALYSSVLFVILLYVLVAVVAVGSLPVAEIVGAKDYALAAAAKPFLGSFGFRLIAVAALLSTFSAINATLYGAARLSYTIAKEGELPAFLEDEVWNKPLEGLFITSALALLLANLADLSSISMMGSAGFLLIFAAVNAANVRLAKKTGSRGAISVVALLACLLAFGTLIWQTLATEPARVWVLAGMAGLAFLVELGYREVRGYAFRLGRDESG
jgi:amino acid transporter